MFPDNLTRAEAQARAALIGTDTYAVHVDLSGRDVEDPTRLFTSTTRIRLTAREAGSLHVDLIAEYLEAVHRRDVTRLIINVPPGYLKSIAVNVAWPAWELGQNPSERHCQVAGLMDAFDRAARHLSCLRRHLDARLLPPDPESLGTGIAVLSSRHQMPPRTEMAIDHRVG